MSASLSKVTLTLDGAEAPPMLVQEQQQAIADLLEDSQFQPVAECDGPFALDLSLHDGRMVMTVTCANGTVLPHLILSLKPYARIIADYFMMVESYTKVAASGNPYQLEAVDMGRRGVHDEAATLLRQRLLDKVSMDHATARRLFTLICILHMAQTRHSGKMHNMG